MAKSKIKASQVDPKPEVIVFKNGSSIKLPVLDPKEGGRGLRPFVPHPCQEEEFAIRDLLNDKMDKEYRKDRLNGVYDEATEINEELIRNLKTTSRITKAFGISSSEIRDKFHVHVPNPIYIKKIEKDYMEYVKKTGSHYVCLAEFLLNNYNGNSEK